MYANDPGQFPPAGGGSGDDRREKVLYQEQIGLHLVEDLEGPDR